LAVTYLRYRSLDFFDFAGFNAFRAGVHAFIFSIHDGFYGLQVGQEAAVRYTGYLLADSAVFFCLTASCDRAPGDGFFAANVTYSAHDYILFAYCGVSGVKSEK